MMNEKVFNKIRRIDMSTIKDLLLKIQIFFASVVTQVWDIVITKNYWLWIFWVVLTFFAYSFANANPDSVFLENLAIKLRNISLYMACISCVRKLELVSIKVEEKIFDGLKDPNSPSYGSALIAIAIYFGLIISGGAAVIVASM